MMLTISLRKVNNFHTDFFKTNSLCQPDLYDNYILYFFLTLIILVKWIKNHGIFPGRP